VVWSEKLIELGNSWYSAKTILVEHSFIKCESQITTTVGGLFYRKNHEVIFDSLKFGPSDCFMFGSTALDMRSIPSDWGTYSSINYI